LVVNLALAAALPSNMLAWPLVWWLAVVARTLVGYFCVAAVMVVMGYLSVSQLVVGSAKAPLPMTATT